MKKIINKYSALGVKYFILDTFKAGDDYSNKQTWEEMMHDMRKLYDTVKPSNKNVHLWATLQLKKDKVGSRYLTQDNIGMSKNVVDVCSTVILMRQIREDEKDGGKNAIKVYRLEGKNGRTKIPVTLHEDKNYMIIFIDKNREGESGHFQIVVEINLGRNTYREVGVTGG
jgi:replicative DNA helicase